jgi:hypothetical protein
MNRKHELAALRGICRIDENPDERVSAYKRQKLVLSAIGWVLIFTAFFLATAYKEISPML